MAMNAAALFLLSWTFTLAGGMTSSRWSTSLADDDDFRIVSYSGTPIDLIHPHDRQFLPPHVSDVTRR